VPADLIQSAFDLTLELQARKASILISLPGHQFEQNAPGNQPKTAYLTEFSIWVNLSPDLEANADAELAFDGSGAATAVE